MQHMGMVVGWPFIVIVNISKSLALDGQVHGFSWKSMDNNQDSINAFMACNQAICWAQVVTAKMSRNCHYVLHLPLHGHGNSRIIVPCGCHIVQSAMSIREDSAYTWFFCMGSICVWVWVWVWVQIFNLSILLWWSQKVKDDFLSRNVQFTCIQTDNCCHTCGLRWLLDGTLITYSGHPSSRLLTSKMVIYLKVWASGLFSTTIAGAEDIVECDDVVMGWSQGCLLICTLSTKCRPLSTTMSSTYGPDSPKDFQVAGCHECGWQLSNESSFYSSTVYIGIRQLIPVRLSTNMNIRALLVPTAVLWALWFLNLFYSCHHHMVNSDMSICASLMTRIQMSLLSCSEARLAKWSYR